MMMENKTKDLIRQEALKAIQDYHRAGLAISVGVGKTLIGLTDMASIYQTDNNAQFLVVGPKKSIMNTWFDEADKFNLGYLKDRIRFTTYLSLHKQDLNYTKVYLDEMHSLKNGHASWLRFYQGPILGLSGTPPKHFYTEKGKMVDEFCPIAYEYLVDDAVDDKILNDYKIYIHYVQLDTAKNLEQKTRNGNVFYTSEQQSYEYWTNRLSQASGKELQICRLMRMKALQKFKSKERYAKQLANQINDKCMIFANEQAQADRLCTYSYHSNNPKSEENLELFKTGKINKLSCVLQLSEGINIPGLKQSIIMHSYSNNTKFMQRFGRNVRLHVDDVAIIHLLCYINTIDEEWIENALEKFNPDKIIKLDHEFINL
jgi:superfamily II DNA or RNA helicase